MGDQQAQVDAFAVAESGLERYVALLDTQPVPDRQRGDSNRSPRYRLRRVIPDPATGGGTPGTVRASAHAASVTVRRDSAPTRHRAQRTVAQYRDVAGSVDGRGCRMDARSRGLRSKSDHGHARRQRQLRDAGAAGARGLRCPSARRPARRILRQASLPAPDPVPCIDDAWTASAAPRPTAPPTCISTGMRIVNGSVLQPDYTLTSASGWPAYSSPIWPVVGWTAT